MWKYVSRRIRDTFERSVNHFDKRSGAGVINSANGTSTSDDKSTCSAPPCRWLFSRKCCGSYQKDDNTKSNWRFEHINRTWIDAISWSSALVLGWYASQIVHLKVKYQNKKSCVAIKNLCSTLYPYVSSVNENAVYNNNIENVIKKFVPTVHLISNDKTTSPTESSCSSGTYSNADSDSDLGSVLNSIENRLGLAAIENGQHKEGLSLLRSAANRNHPPALYNLGLCYETGLGVKPDEKMAMELYRSAASLEHPGALYNLGIYYGQGRGGLSRNTNTAKRLLRLAAVKGQQDAINALKSLEDQAPVAPIEPHINEGSWVYSPFTHNDNLIPPQSSFFVENVNLLHNCEGTTAY